MRKFSVPLLAAALLLSAGSSSAMDTFVQAKKILPEITRQLENPATVYCGIPIQWRGKRWFIDPQASGYQVRKNAKRAARIEAEHVMPAWEFGHALPCWKKKGGRKNCGETSELFNRMEGDLHNLWPAAGEVNGDRSNYQFTDWNAQPGMYGTCEMVIDFKGKKAQPPKAARGLIARAYLYMSDRYDVRLSKSQRRLYEAWDRMYPPAPMECRRNQLVKKYQGNDNPFITARCGG